MINAVAMNTSTQSRSTARIVARVSSRMMCITATYFLIQALLIMQASSITG